MLELMTSTVDENGMIRMNNWKLIFYNGYQSELYNLETDPFEQHDLSHKDKYLNIKNKLEKLVLSNWHPDQISKRMRILKQEQIIQIEWAKNTDPNDTLRWDLDPEKDSTRLDTDT